MFIFSCHLHISRGRIPQGSCTAPASLDAAHQLLEENRLPCQGVEDGLLQTLYHWLHKGLELVSILVIDGLFLVVDAGVVEDLDDVFLEVLLRPVGTLIDLARHLLQVHGLLDDLVVIGDLLGIHRLLEWPGVYVLIQLFQNVLALLLESLFLPFLGQVIALDSPASLFEPGDLIEGKLFALVEPEPLVDPDVAHLEDLGDNRISLLLQGLRDVNIVDVSDDLALHHGASVVVLDVPLPLGFGHVGVRAEPLLFEELCRVVVCIGTKVVESLLLCVVLQAIHQAGTQTADLLGGSDSQKDDFREPLGPEGSENAPTEDLRPLPLLPPHDDHGLMLAVHGEFDDVVAGHPWQLLGDYVLQLD